MNSSPRLLIALGLKSILVLGLIFSSSSLLLAQADEALSPILMKGMKVEGKGAEMLAKAYCKDIEADKAFLLKLNALAANNLAQLKVGSALSYAMTNVRYDLKGKEVERSETLENWTITALVQNVATISIKARDAVERVQEIKLFPTIYSQIPDPKDPITCLYWKAFAETKKTLEYDMNGTKIPAMYRSQANLSNVLPEFFYGEGIPLNILETIETSTYSESKVVKVKKLQSFKF